MKKEGIVFTCLPPYKIDFASIFFFFILIRFTTIVYIILWRVWAETNGRLFMLFSEDAQLRDVSKMLCMFALA